MGHEGGDVLPGVGLQGEGVMATPLAGEHALRTAAELGDEGVQILGHASRECGLAGRPCGRCARGPAGRKTPATRSGKVQTEGVETPGVHRMARHQQRWTTSVSRGRGWTS